MGNWGTGQMSEHLTDADHMKYIDRSFEHEKASEKSFATGHLGAPAFSTQKVLNPGYLPSAASQHLLLVRIVNVSKAD